MKTGSVRDPGGDSGSYLEVDGWTPWQSHIPVEELETYYRDCNALMMKLERMPPAVRARLRRIEFRCPVKGCLLATVYWMPRRPTVRELEHDHRIRSRMPTAHRSRRRIPQPGQYLYVGRTAGRTEVYDILNYLFDLPSAEWPDGFCTHSCALYWRAGCRHGTARIDDAAIYDMFSLADRCHLLSETEEEAVARLPEKLRPLWGKRVFHPDPSAWRPKVSTRCPVASAKRS